MAWIGLATERAAGASWTIQAIPAPPNASAVLSGVSCATATACLAVGSTTPAVSNSSPEALAEAWDGTTWRILSPPVPIGSKSSELGGVSCVSTTDCAAVGSYVNHEGFTLTLAARWDGSTWAIQPTPNTYPAFVGCDSVPCIDGGTESGDVLRAVSCSSADACTAVGSQSNGRDVAALAERWDGSKWSVQATPNPNKGLPLCLPTASVCSTTASPLLGVSCSTGGDCLAVGDTVDKSGRDGTLAMHWNGSAWAIVSPSNTSQMLAGVSCTSPSACTAVGDTIAERWDGTSWSMQPIATPADLLRGVSCLSSSSCEAVGYRLISPAGTAAEGWDGSIWSSQSTPNPAGAFESVLSGLSCTSASACMAVGEYNQDFPLSERYS